MFLGGSNDGARLNELTHENVNETEILQILDQWFSRFAAQGAGQSFGDFVAGAI